jgi:phenylacetate-CoA ligase
MRSETPNDPTRWRQVADRELYPDVAGLLTTLVIERWLRAPYLSTAAWLREFDAWDGDRRRAWQDERLGEILAHARRHVPYYRARADAAGGDPRAALARMPVVDKALIRADMEAFLSDRTSRTSTVTKRTGGSTGDPWEYPLDRTAWTHMYAAQLHFFERAGVRYGEPVLTLGVPRLPGLTTGWKANLRRRLERKTLSATSFEVDPDASLRRAREALAAGATLWYGYAGTLAAMAHAVLDAGLEVRGPRAIVTTAEPLHPAWRDAIERAFRSPLYDEYGCNDGGVLAQSCPRGRFHLAENLSVVEVLDGDTPCPQGVEGDIAITNLHARALPFIRYRNGDRGVLGEGACPCGRAGATLERIAGRTGDRVRLRDGTLLSVMTFAQVFKLTPGVRRWQVVQPDVDRLVVRLDVRPDFDDVQGATILDYVRARTNGRVEVSLSVSEPIVLTPAGKHKVVVRNGDPAPTPMSATAGRGDR